MDLQASSTATATATTSTTTTTTSSILSEKVARALAVRTDTPAMKAALDALSTLPEMDARSVRVAMEHDALQQALALQKELQSLCQIVTTLRQGMGEVAQWAHSVSRVCGDTTTTTSSSSTTTTSMSVVVGVTTDTLPPASAAVEHHSEAQLASTLADAFVHRNQSRQRLKAMTQFLETFHLSEEDARLLDHYTFEENDDNPNNNSAGAVNGMAFLQALERVRHIRTALSQSFHDNSSNSNNNDSSSLGANSALRLMESLALKQERAYERLYHWLQKIITTNNNNENSDETLMNLPFCKQALQALQAVPAFYSHSMELIASTRRSEQTRRFLVALTNGYDNMPPLEMKSHDPVAYVGDMLAFSFRAFSVEADMAKNLLSWEENPTHNDNDESKNDEEHSQQQPQPRAETAMIHTNDALDFMDKPMSSADMLAMSVSGLARPLKARILQVVSTLSRRPDDDNESDDGMGDLEEEDVGIRNRLTHLYEICGLLLFYASVMEKGIVKLQGGKTEAEQGEKNPLVECLLECLLEAAKAYEASIRVYGAMLEHLSTVTGDSEAALTHAMLVLVADVRIHSPGYSVEVECPSDCRDILSLEWVTKTLVESALVTCKTLDDAVALQRSVTASKKAGMSIVAAEELDEAIDNKEAELIDQLVDTELVKVLDLCGLGSLVSTYREWQEVQAEGTLMATYPGLSQQTVETAMKEFYSSLYSPPLPSLETIVKDPRLRRAARSKIASKVSETYAELYESIMSSGQGGYDEIGFLGHDPEQVKTLFSA